MKTLIQIQEIAIAKLSVTRSSEKRYVKLIGSVRRWYGEQLRTIGFNDDAQIRATWFDAIDMLNLRKEAE